MWEAGAASLVGSLWSARSGEIEASRNRDWQANMSSTAYQRQMADMRAAGLNPILAAGAGGASTPPGAMAPPPDPAMGERAVNTAVAYKRSQAEYDQIIASAENQTAQSMATSQSIKGIISDNRRKAAEASAAEYGLNSARTASEIAGSKVGKGLSWIDRVLGTANSATSVIKPYSLINRSRD